jgi:hypothetical protein
MAKINDHLTSNSFTHDTQLNAEVHVAYQMAWENRLVLGDDTEIGSSKAIVNPSLLPVGIMTMETIQGKSFPRLLKVLFDSGSSRTLINTKIIPSNVAVHHIRIPLTLHTGGGNIQESNGVRLKGIRFPELSPTRTRRSNRQ